MTFSLPFVIAQAAPAPRAGGGMSMIIFMAVIFAAMYFLMIRPQTKRQKEHRAMVAALAKGDEVVTNGGVVGRVKNVDDSFIQLEIATDVSISLQKSAVSQVLPKGTLKLV